MTAVGGSWNVRRAGVNTNLRLNEYYDCMNLGNEIKETVERMRQDIRDEVIEQNTPKTAVTCPYCGATTIPDENGCCEYCGGAVNG